MKTRILFCDLGNVILPFDFEPAMKKMAALSGKSVDQVRNIFFQPGFQEQYETGKISSQGFLNSVRRALGLRNRGQPPISDEELVFIWNNVFTQNRPMIQWLESVLGKFPIWLLSNTNELHWKFVWERYPVVRKFTGWILSHEIGLRKPDPKFFQAALEKSGCLPQEVFFVDDMEVHVQSARSVGIQAEVFQGVKALETRYRLEKSADSR